MRHLPPVVPALSLALGLLLLGSPRPSHAQGRPDPAALLNAQRAAMKPLAYMDGVWRGPAWTILPDGSRHEVTQTERIGAFLDGTVKVMEGRGYDASGTVAFNALGIVSFDPATKKHSMHSYAMGRSGDFSFAPNDSGFVWEIPAGPMTIRYTAVVRNNRWREIGHRIAPGAEPVQFFEMNLVRVRDTDWPAAGAVPLRD